ncbi:TIGR03960 family B12-binding radical SAM protein [Candidatus Sumerlaeota bacterium]|nr:TIGR03960 family B12-binding radical SAM protein [Candidatus Sumerlaeota bacterium]
MFSRIEPLLNRVDKPGRYVGGEINAVKKDWDATQARIALAFPDIYDIGMSYHGFRILYEHINRRPEFLADRTYAPWPDMERELRGANVPLYALDQMRPLSDYDIIGFTLQYEMNYTNVLSMLDLADIAPLADERGEKAPMIIAGGEGAVAPEPLAMFIDAFVLGDGEDAVIEILEACAQWKREGADRAERLRRLDAIPGVYVPSMFEAEYNADNTLKAFYRKEASGELRDAEPIRKRIYDLRRDSGSLKPIMPMVEAVHNRLVIEIKRGCTRGCRFCAAGMITRPIRERTPEQILEIAQTGIENTGYREISLLSLSSADYTCLLPTVQLLNANLSRDMVSISLPSLRINAFDVRLAAEISKVRKTGFTFAPEAGSERLRKVINKVISQDDVLKIVDEVTRLGWRTLKFYFMIGLPTEDYTDLDGIVELVESAWRIGRQRHGGRLTINVSLSPFVPKPHTPFQWEPQLDQEELRKRYEHVAQGLRKLRGVALKRHDLRCSMLEAVLARGDRRVGLAILEAWKRGCRFDGWDEWHLHHEWLNAFEAAGVDPSFYAHRMRDKDELLPWDHIGMNLGKRFLWKERQCAYDMRETADCSCHECAGCEACDPENGLDHELVRDARRKRTGDADVNAPSSELETQLPDEFKFGLDQKDTDDSGKRIDPKRALGTAAMQADPVQRVRMAYRKTGRQRYISHLDMIRFLQLLTQRLRLPVKWSEGYHPKPVMQFAPPLSLGFAAEEEHFDLFFYQRADPDRIMAKINAIAPEGIEFHSAREVELRGPSLDATITGAIYAAELQEEHLPAIREIVERFHVSDSYIVEVQRKRGAKPLELKEVLAELALEGARLTLHVRSQNNSLINPLSLLKGMCPELESSAIRWTRRRLLLPGA